MLEILPAPTLTLDQPVHRDFELERESFWKMHDELLKIYDGQYVVIYQGKVVSTNIDRLSAIDAAYKKVGYVPVYTHLVSRGSEPICRSGLLRNYSL